MKWTSYFIVPVFLFAFGTSIITAKEVQTEESHFSLASFDFGAVWLPVLTGSGSSAFPAEIGWDPYYFLSDWFAVRLDFGFILPTTSFKDIPDLGRDTNRLVFLNAKVFATFFFLDHFGADIGTGVVRYYQTDITNSTAQANGTSSRTDLAVALDVFVRIGSDPYRLNRIYFGFDTGPFFRAYVSYFRLGAGISF